MEKATVQVLTTYWKTTQNKQAKEEEKDYDDEELILNETQPRI